MLMNRWLCIIAAFEKQVIKRIINRSSCGCGYDLSGFNFYCALDMGMRSQLAVNLVSFRETRGDDKFQQQFFCCKSI